MTLAKYQIHTIILLLALLVLALPWVTSAAGIIVSTVWTVVVAFFGFFVGLAGSLLDVAINYAVIGFGNNFKTGGVGIAVDALWVAIRDIFNLTFIFGLVFIGFKMILNSDDSGTRRWLIHLILAALLINFSLYITKFIVDFTNILATEIAQAFPLDNNKNMSISFGFMNSLGITSLLSFQAPEGDSPWAHVFGSAILFLVMIFSFGAGAILLLIRYAVLCLYMVFSPLMFLGWVFPQLQSVTSKYWSGFLGRAFFAPIYLLLLYFSYYVIATIYAWNNANSKTPQFNAIFKSDPTKAGSVTSSVEGTLMTFFIACIFLIASIVIASKLGADGANTAVSMGKSASNWGKRQVVGGTKFVAAQTGGRAVRRGANLVGNSLERQISKLQTKNGMLGRLARTQAGEAARKGSAGLRDAKVGLGVSLQEDRQRSAAIGAAATKRVKDQENNTKRNESAEKYKEENRKANDMTLSEADRDKAAKEREIHRADLAQRTKNTSDDELLAMDKEQLMEIAEHLSDKQLETLEKSGNFSTFGDDSDIAKLKKARGDNTFGDYVKDMDDATTSTVRLSDAIKAMADRMKNMSDERLTGMDANHLKNKHVAMHLSSDQMKTLKSSGKYSAAEIAEIEKAREDGINATITNGSTVDTAANTNALDASFQDTQRQNIFKRSVADIGNLPVSVFTKKESFKNITPAMLEARLKNGVSGQEDAIRAALAEHLNVTPNDLTMELQTHPGLQNNVWRKWLDSKSIWSQQFFV
ncbi:MAG: hypothetical protein KBC35_00395 [Candidatus Pacebacteria bacterium]|nr:hypothetical protein [Candidatus Paceibacterota bacterium]